MSKKKIKRILLYCLLVRKIAQYPNIKNILQSDFNFSIDQLRESFSLPHSVVLKSYVKGFQFKVPNSILYTNSKLHKIGFKTDDLCSFCKAEPETLCQPFLSMLLCQMVLEWVSRLLAPNLKSASSPFPPRCFIWNIIQTMPFTQFTELFYNNWKTIHIGLQKMPI